MEKEETEDDHLLFRRVRTICPRPKVELLLDIEHVELTLQLEHSIKHGFVTPDLQFERFIMQPT